MRKPNTSLWWKLSWQLSLVFAAVVVTVTIGLCIYGTAILSPHVAVKHKMGSMIAAAATRDDQGRLAISDTPDIQSFKKMNSGLWYVLTTTDGASLSYGIIPAPYAELAHLTHLIREADIRGAAETNEIASIEHIDTPAGEVRFLFGGTADKGWPFLTILTGMFPVYVPLLAIALPAIFIAVPRIVHRALAGVSEVARRASEIELRRQGARLPTDGIPEEVAPLVIAFNGTLERLETEFQRRQRFLIDAAHEFRTPIAIMQTRIEGMPEGLDRRRLLGDVARLAATAEQLLDFERNDQATDLHENVDLVEITRTVVADLAPIAIAAGYDIAFDSVAEKLERKGSSTSLPSAISNLVRNAIDHGTNSGAITVSVSANREITVADQGKGIPEEHQKLVFEPFYRVTPRSKGAGLGLSLVKQIVANHCGKISLESGPTGTRITLHL